MAEDTANEPLMGQEDAHEDADGLERNRDDGQGGKEDGLTSPGLYVWLLTFSAGISGLLFGYDTGVISATLVSIHSSLGHPLTIIDKSLITSATSLFALLISPISGLLADSLGRKTIILLADLAFIIGALLQCLSTSVTSMILGRSVVGIAVGAGSFVAPLYIAELAPAKWRGRLVMVNVLFITVGQVVAYVVGWAFARFGSEGMAWRWMVGLGAVPAVVQVGVMVGMPETPRWLVMVGKREKAEGVLRKVCGKERQMRRMVRDVLIGIESEVEEERLAKTTRRRGQNKKDSKPWFAESRDLWAELFRIPGNRRALTIACLLQGLQQLCGFNSLMYFSATIFTILGFSSPTLTSLSVALTNFIMTCVALILIDRIGRRKILLYSIPVMAAGLLFCAIGFKLINLPQGLSNPTTVASPAPSPTSSISTFAPIFVLISIMLYVASYALGLGNVPWMQSELFPLNVRALGSGLSTSTNWAANFVVGLTFLPMMEALSPTWTFVVYALVCGIGWWGVWAIYPELKGLGLEEVGEILGKGWGVR